MHWRLALACAIVGRPELVFLDEPTAGMDPQARHLVWQLVTSLRRDGVAVLLTTHLMEEAEALAEWTPARLRALAGEHDLDPAASPVALIAALRRADPRLSLLGAKQLVDRLGTG